MTALTAVLLALSLAQGAGSQGALPNGMTPRWNTSYCAGYQAGFTKGWCNDTSSICPVPAPPTCPPPQPGRTDWSDAYVRGFSAGQEAHARLPGYRPPTPAPKMVYYPPASSFFR